MRRVLVLLSILMLVPGWLWAAETVSTTPSAAGPQPAVAVHSAKKKTSGQTASKPQASPKKNGTVSKSSKGKKSQHHR